VNETTSAGRASVLISALLDPAFRSALRTDVPSALAAAGIEPGSQTGDSLRREIEEFFGGEDHAPAADVRAPVSLDIAATDGGASAGVSPRVGFVVMPWAETRWASIGVSLLKSALAADDLDSDILYCNLDFAETIGNAIYNHVGAASPKTALIGDWLFAEPPPDNPAADERFAGMLLAEYGDFFDFATMFRLGEIRAVTVPYLDALAGHDVWSRYDVLGFTSTFQQNVAVLALADRLKLRYPHLSIVMGGGNCEGPMGPAILRNYPAVDYVFQGEAESLIARFVTDLRATGGHAGWLDADGFWSSRTTSLPDGRAVIVCDSARNMDDVPIPTYHDFYERLRHRRPDSTLPAETAVPIETSRGCWWGEKKHCTFCGLNGMTMAFRSKSAARAFNELRELVHAYGLGPKRRTHVLVVDNILDYRYFNDLLPMIADSDLRVTLHYEVKANLRLDQLMLLRDAGVYHLQPGIESLSNRLLEAMRKGITRLRNLQTMKWCAELGIDVSWNYLHGFPGETDDDYADLPGLFGLLSHLAPPEHVGPARADRFSPFYETPRDFGIVELRREPAYDHVYPDLTAGDRDELAYFFRLTCDGSLASEEMCAAVRVAADRWRGDHSEARLEARWVDDRVRILDTRPGRPRPETEFELDPDASRLLVALDQLRSAGAVERALATPLPSARVTEILDQLVESGLVVADETGYLALPILIRRGMPVAATETRRVRALPLMTKVG
jgi:ribosomal peptide maturation radical SAM protein 1